MMDRPPPPPPPPASQSKRPGPAAVDPNAMPPPPPSTRAPMISKAIVGADGDMPPPPPAAGPNVEGRDKILLEMQKRIFGFYSQFNQSKLDPSVFALALQLWWDEGLVKLNEKLMAKYGRKIDTPDFLDEFDRKGEDVTVIPKVDLHAGAGDKHLMVKTVLKTNNGDFFHSDKRANSARFLQSQRFRTGESAKTDSNPRDLDKSGDGDMELEDFETNNKSSGRKKKAKSKKHGNKSSGRKHGNEKKHRKKKKDDSDEDVEEEEGEEESDEE